jgi:hypothetical protein
VLIKRLAAGATTTGSQRLVLLELLGYLSLGIVLHAAGASGAAGG